MIPRAASTFGVLVLAACSKPWLPPQELRAAFDWTYVQAAGKDPYSRCETIERARDGAEYYSSIAQRACYSFAQRRVFRGVYVDEFEGQAFVEGASGKPPYTRSDRAWLSFDERSKFSTLRELRPDDGKTRVWLINFIGQKTKRLSRYGHGHMGGSAALIVVDHVQSARLIASYDGYLPAAVRADQLR